MTHQPSFPHWEDLWKMQLERRFSHHHLQQDHHRSSYGEDQREKNFAELCGFCWIKYYNFNFSFARWLFSPFRSELDQLPPLFSVSPISVRALFRWFAKFMNVFLNHPLDSAFVATAVLGFPLAFENLCRRVVQSKRHKLWKAIPFWNHLLFLTFLNEEKAYFSVPKNNRIEYQHFSK